MPREASKCREWEKVRRDRLKECFTKLCKQLPTYDPSVTFSKIEILEKATKHIVDLQSKTTKLLVPEDTKKAEKNEIKVLYDRIKKLLLRNEQLSNLLKDAGIKIPKEIGIVKKFKSPLPWSNKITPEQAKILAKKEAQREANKSKPPLKKVGKAKNKLKPQGVKLKFKKCDGKKLKKVKSSKSLIAATRPAVTSNSTCFIITNAPSKAIPSTRNSTVVTNTSLLTTPLVAATVKPPSVAIIPKKNTPLSSLGPGTLILANGNVVPVLPSIPALLPTVSSNILTNQPVIVNTTTNNSTILVVKTTTGDANTTNTNAKKKQGTNTLPVIKPKMRSLKNIPPNKVPIPPLSVCVVENKNDNTNRKEQKAKETATEENKSKSDTKKSVGVKRKTDSIVVVEEKRLKTPNGNKNDEKQSGVDDKNVAEVCDVINETKESDSIKEVEEKDKNEVVANDIETTPPEINIEKIIESNGVDLNTNDKKNDEKSAPPPKEPETTIIHTQNAEKSPDKVVDTNKLEMNLPHSELSNDIFASLQVPTGAQNPESTSPTAAFLLAFPLVSTLTGVKVSEVIEEENSDSQRGTPTLLQIGTMDTTKPTQSQSESLTPNLLNLDTFSFFSSSNFYSGFDNFLTTTSTVTTTTAVSESVTKVSASKSNGEPQKIGGNNEAQKSVMQNKHDVKYTGNEPVNSSKSNFVYCNTFNPFMDVSKPNSVYPTDNNHYYGNAESNLNQQDYAATTKTSMKSDSYVYYDNTCGDFNKVQQFPDGYCNSKDKYASKSKSNPRPPVNWMTTPDVRQQIVTTTDYLLPSVDFTNTSIYSSNSFVTNTQQSYFNTNASLYSTPSDLNTSSFSMHANFQRNDDGHFCWPIETQPNFVSSTLPTLVGDLALGTTSEKDSPKNLNKPKENLRKSKMAQPTYDNQSNLFSVSQLVDHNHGSKTAEGLPPARTTNRRNSGSRSKNNVQKNQKRLHKNDNKDFLQNQKQYLACPEQNWLTNTNKTQKNTPSSYSAEALIGQQKPPTKPFLSENIIPYFSSMDLPQEQNQNYQSGSFPHSFVSTIQNGTYSTNSFANTTSLSANYLPATNFMSEIDYGPVISDNINLFPHPNKQFNKNLPPKVTTNRTEERKSNVQQNLCTDGNGNLKKPKRKPPDSNLPASGFVDFSFLSMPGSINSPILPDDFHTHANFLPPPAPSQLYPCKNPLYPKQTTELATTSLLQFPPPATRPNNVQPEISPSVNNIGTSLANFNLSTIFPEINKGPIADVYGDSARNKNFSHRNYLPATPQIPFNKSSFSSSYISTSNSFTNG